MQSFENFAHQLIGNPSLYDNYKTFYIRMRNADSATKSAYNAIKNALMSYAAKVDRNNCVRAELGPNEEVFIAGDTVAKFVISSGQLFVHLNVDPRTQSTRKAMFKVVGDHMIRYKLEKGNVVTRVLETVPKIMAAEDFSSLSDYQEEDYASYFTRDIEDRETTEIITVSQKEYEEYEQSDTPPNVEPAEPVRSVEAHTNSDVVYDDYYSRNRPQRKLDDVHIDIPVGTPTEDELAKAELERQERLKKPKAFREIASYGYEFVWGKILAFYGVTILVALALIIAFRLKLLWSLILIVGYVLMMPMLVKAYFRTKYEEKRYLEVTTYIEQMLYSFRKNSKINVSLRDALTVFPEHARMYDTLLKAIHYAQTTDQEGNLYENTLAIIEKEYPCRRIRSLHRYMIKVEGVGGDHSSGVDALLKDRRLWVERVEEYKKEAAAVLLDIYISIGFAVGLSCVVVRLMETPLVDIPSNLLYQISTVVFLLICAFTICLTVKKTVLDLDDGENQYDAQKIINKINWLRNYHPENEFKGSVILAVIFAIFCVVGLIFKNMLLIIVGGLLIFYALILKTPMKKRSATKSVSRAIEKVYPDWLLELALLLQIDNLHVAIEKTLDSAPLILRGDLTQLDNEILANPTGIEPFASFFDFLPVHQVHSSMLLLYSISEFGQEKSNTQILELVERNSMMMDKAEKLRNDDRLAATFILKFIPMGLSSMKLMCDLVVMLLAYMNVLATAM